MAEGAGGLLSKNALAALDALQITCPELWQYVRECGQALLVTLEHEREAKAKLRQSEAERDELATYASEVKAAILPLGLRDSEWIPSAIKRALLELSEARNDVERFEFLLSCLNVMDLYAEFVNTWVPGCTTSRERASSSEWRRRIDAARGKATPERKSTPAPGPAEPAKQYSPAGNYCSLCNVHDQWCKHIQPPSIHMAPDEAAIRADQRQRDAEALRRAVALRFYGRHDHTYSGAAVHKFVESFVASVERGDDNRAARLESRAGGRDAQQ